MPKQPKEPEQTFENAIERLEKVVEEMESDRLPLDKLLDRYEEGTQLVKICQAKLDAAERRIEIISRSASGKVQLAELDTPSTPPPSSPKPVPQASTSDDDDEVSLF